MIKNMLDHKSKRFLLNEVARCLKQNWLDKQIMLQIAAGHSGELAADIGRGVLGVRLVCGCAIALWLLRIHKMSTFCPHSVFMCFLWI
jgi:hypothetical protein